MRARGGAAVPILVPLLVFLFGACGGGVGTVPDGLPDGSLDAPVPPPPPPPPPPPVDACFRVPCSGHGTCQVQQGTATCVCDAGYMPDGLNCIGDLDMDGFTDDMEFQLAQEYAPVLTFSASEDVSERTPHWAVLPYENGITIFYGLSYVEDGGDVIGGLFAHVGDSEFIVADVRNDGSLRYFLSAHYLAPATDGSGWYDISEFELDVLSPGMHPIVWVAESKHANYPSEDACDDGALFTDRCDEGRLEDLGLDPNRNLGQSWAPMIDRSDMFIGGTEFHEWYWTDVPFCGWTVQSDLPSGRGECTPEQNSYMRQLRAWEDDLL